MTNEEALELRKQIDEYLRPFTMFALAWLWREAEDGRRR